MPVFTTNKLPELILFILNLTRSHSCSTNLPIFAVMILNHHVDLATERSAANAGVVASHRRSALSAAPAGSSRRRAAKFAFGMPASRTGLQVA